MLKAVQLLIFPQLTGRYMVPNLTHKAALTMQRSSALPSRMNGAAHAVHTATFSGAQSAICAQHGHSLPTIDFVWLRTIGKHLEGIVLAE